MSWDRAWRLGLSMWQTGVALQETAIAAPIVIGNRSQMIDDAIRNPLTGNYAELAKMAPEKIDAFGRAGASLIEDWIGLQTEMMSQWRDIAALSMPGGASDAKLRRIGERAMRMTERAGKAGGKALAPVHAAATANQWRLTGKKSRTAK